MASEILRRHFPDRIGDYFLPMRIGSTAASADEGAALILAGTKTATSSAHWHYPDGRIPFVGALSVLVDGADMPRAIVETTRVELTPLASVEAAFAWSYGEGERTLDWWRRVIGDWYRADAARHGHTVDESTIIICEWLRVACVLEPAR